MKELIDKRYKMKSQVERLQKEIKQLDELIKADAPYEDDTYTVKMVHVEFEQMNKDAIAKYIDKHGRTRIGRYLNVVAYDRLNIRKKA